MVVQGAKEMAECKFKQVKDAKGNVTKDGCTGGHTTAQHHMNVYERVIKQECGIEAHNEIARAVDSDAKTPYMVAAFVGSVMAQTGCDRTTAIDRVAALCALTKMHLDKI
jgi:hypothetical protein